MEEKRAEWWKTRGWKQTRDEALPPRGARSLLHVTNGSAPKHPSTQAAQGLRFAHSLAETPGSAWDRVRAMHVTAFVQGGKFDISPMIETQSFALLYYTICDRV